MRNAREWICLSVMALLVPSGGAAAEVRPTFESAVSRAGVLELYTSEGCSSCPPAEQAMARLRDSPQLWKTFVPVQFHVDYWNGLGWPDPYSRSEYTARQRRYAASWGTGTVYTPGFIFNGRELRPAQFPSLNHGAEDIGRLSIYQLDSDRYRAEFSPVGKKSMRLELTAVVMANDLRITPDSGENRGAALLHHFTVLQLATAPMSLRDGRHEAIIRLSEQRSRGNRIPGDRGRRSLAFWVSQSGSLTPLQATGGDLP